MTKIFTLKRLTELKLKFVWLILIIFSSSLIVAQTATITSPTVVTTYTAGTTVNLTYSLSPATFTAGNVFTPQLSDASGSFTSPVNLATRTASTGATGTQHQIVIPFNTPTGSGYRIRVLSSNPAITHANNGANLTITALAINSPSTTGSTYCQGEIFNVTYSQNGPLAAGNVYTVQLSDASGSFTSPTAIGTRTSTTAAAISCTMPFLTPGSGYRVRIVSSNPALTSPDNGVNLTLTGLAINTPTTTSLIYCQGEVFNLSYTQSCPFSAGNIYSVQLSDGSGSFAAPTTIGTRTATTAAAISCTIPAVPFGSGYRVRVVASNPVVTSPNNGFNLTINVPSGSPSVAGNGAWNAYCFNAANNYTLNYQGFFTENNLSFDTRTRYTSTSYPASANTASGNAYAGCTFTNTNNYSIAFKRTNIPCGYYNITFAHDDEGRIFIDGAQVYYNPYIGGGVQQAYRGFISPTNTVEVRYSNTGGGPGFAAVNITTLSAISVFNPATICAGTSASLTATNATTVPLTFDWTPAAFASPTTGTATTVSPTVTTIFTVSATDAVSGCGVTNTVQITVNPVATTTVVSTATTALCSGYTTATLTAGGAASYTWSPASGLSAVNGFSVIANPTVTTTYTVSGSNNCNTVDATTTVTMQVIPAAPTPTVFGNNTWNVYCYDGRAFTNYYGYYTENNLSFNTTTRWANTPSAANAASGLAYQGCTIPIDFHSTSHKRTNFTCGYYQIDIPAHDDDVTVLVDGVQVFQHIGCCDAHTNVWTGFLGTSTTVEIRHQEGNGGTYVAANFVLIPYPVLSAPVTICAGTTTSLTASPFISGATYSWTPSADLSSSTGSLVVASPTVGTSYTCTVTDPVTTCSAAASVSITVDPLPSTTVSPTSATIACAAQSRTLTAGGANTYSWSPSAGLNTTIGSSVIATPSVTTVYTVTGNNNCADVIATSTITVISLVTPTVFPTTSWNVYCHNNTTFSNYFGYYTHIGTGASGYDFNTTTQWASGAAPSTATANASGTAYQGCTMGATNISLSFKRSGFTCGMYTITCNSNDDGVALFIDGTQVASRGTSGAAANLWIGALNVNSQVEFRLNQGGGGSGLRATFTTAPATASLSTWIGTASNDWFTAANWCGSGVPSSTIDVLIPNSKLPNYPVINGAGAACRSLTVSAATPSTAITSALPAATLTINAGNSLDVYGNWINNGAVTANATSTVNLLGTASSSLAGTATETLGSLVFNKTGTVTIPASKVVQIAGDGNFTNGIVNQNGTLRFLNGASTSGANNASYVNGQVIKVGTQAFVFPVGAASYYRPIGISAPSVATDYFTARYILADASPSFTHTLKDASIDHIGRCEYWVLDRSAGGTSNVNVMLSWDATSCGVTNLSDLVVARWNGALWKDHGNGGVTGNTSAGTITSSSVITAFSPFTLASITSSNPLPIELTNFSCSNINRNTNGLNWTTASESNNDYFAIERSSNGAEFNQIAKVNGAGNSLTTLNYAFKDENPLSGISYYRLKQVDFNGKFSYSEICSITNNGDGNISFYPNPVRTSLTIDYEFSEKPKSNVVSVTDVTGKLVSVSSSFLDSKVTIDCSDLAEGIYFLKVLIGDKEVVNKFTVQK